jgi:hypothetical protein
MQFKKLSVAALVMAGALSVSLSGVANATPTNTHTCVETTTVTASPVSPQTVSAGGHVNAIFTASSSTTWTWTVGTVTTTTTADTTGVAGYDFSVVNADSLSAGPVVAGVNSTTYTLPVGTYKVTAAHRHGVILSKYQGFERALCPADGTAKYVINAEPVPTPTVTVPGPTKTVVTTTPSPVITVVRTVETPVVVTRTTGVGSVSFTG